MIRFLFVGFLLLFPAFAGEGVLLIGPELRNGSFEEVANKPPHRPWIIRAREMASAEIEVRQGTEAFPAAEGDHYLVLRVVNQDQKANTGSVTSGRIPLEDSLNPGRKFRLTWKARSRAPEEYNEAIATLIFSSEAASAPLLHRRLRPQSLKGEGWQEMQSELVVPDGLSPTQLEVRLSLSRKTLNKAVQEMEGYIDDVRLEQLHADVVETTAPVAMSAPVETAVLEPIQAPIPVRFKLEKAGVVTLVIEDEEGRRVRNLVSGESFEAGEQVVYWDGMNEGVPRPVPGSPASQAIDRSLVSKGTYRVRGLVRDPIRLTYEMTANPNTGNPPWITERQSGTGGWLADHGVPTACAYIPKGPRGNEEVLIASPVAESGQALAWVDLDGTKVGGRFRLGGNWTGATHLARDRGDRPNAGIYLYTLQRWNELRMMALTPEGAWTAGMIPTEENKPGGTSDQVTGIAVHNAQIVYSTLSPARLNFYDASEMSPSQRAVHVGEAPVETPQAVAFDRKGRLLVLSGKKLIRYPSAVLPLGKPEVVIASGLEEPRALALDEEDRIYIADWGKRHQILVFDPEGKPVQTIGLPGAPAVGPYLADKLNFPYGMTIDSRGQLWVAGYRWRTPKTVSVWDVATGRHLRSYYGPSEYGGGGNLDSKDANRFLYANMSGGVEYEVDWESGKATPKSIYWLAPETPEFSSRWKGPDFARHIGKHRYITSEFGELPTQGGKLTVLRDRSPEGASPLFVISGGHSWGGRLEASGVMNQFPAFVKGGRERHFLLSSLLIHWADLNSDGQIQAEEFSFRTFPQEEVGAFLGVTFGKDYEILITHRRGVLSLKPRSVREDGLPLYDLEDAVSAIGDLVAGQPSAHASGGGQALRAEDGSLIITGGPMMGVRDGKMLWTYHSQWPGLHAGHAAPKAPEYPGQLLATTRLLGPLLPVRKGEAGEVWAVNSDKGMAYLFTSDGLYLDTLFAIPGEGTPWNMPKAERGLDLTRINPGGESFWPTFNTTPDGRLLLVAGKMHSSFVEIHGLESVLRISGEPVSVGEDELAAADRFQRKLAQRRVGSEEVMIPYLSTPPADGADLSQWRGGRWVPMVKGQIRSRFTARDAVWTAASLAVDDQNLYVAVRTREKKDIFDNKGADPESFFSTGGGLDLQLSTRQPDLKRKDPAEGDLRLVIGRNGQQTRAFLYRPVVPETQEPVWYESPVGKTRIDRIDDVSDDIAIVSRRTELTAAQAGAMQEGEFREYLVTIPLATLGWDPEKLPQTRGDIGLLIGREGVTVDRSYWYNQNAGLVNDLPGEARLHPDRWGPWTIIKR